ncbi:MAG: hypothetical protein F4X36_16940 [Gammaproteobacteria bacterium]|nr:hypothetical protein [Gammaproteobacteria bacterium]
MAATINLPGGAGQHFFFDVGNGDMLAFFWFPDAPESIPGVTHSGHLVGKGNLTSAHASMNHVAFSVPLEFAAWTRPLDERDVNAEPMRVEA